MPQLSVADLDAFVAAVDEKGGDYLHPDIAARYYPIDLKFSTVVDQSLDPFSEAYHAQQLALYGELSGRALNQHEGELHPIDIEPLVTAPNPQGEANIRLVSEHVRAISTMLSMSELSPGARVLDLGPGHGLSSEVLAYSGCHVTALDIDPLLSQLSQRRCALRHLPVEHRLMNFENVGDLGAGQYDAAYFFQCLHHAVRPWELIAAIVPTLKPGGLIAFNGEPIQKLWWKHWGLRLDPESLYTIRRHGWFESGWSHEFIAECFRRNGLHFMFVSGGHLGGEMGFASADPARLQAVAGRAAALGAAEFVPAARNLLPTFGYATDVGVRSELLGVPAIQTRQGHSGGALMYGPYAPMAAGRYRVELLLRAEPKVEQPGTLTSTALLDISSHKGANQILREEFACHGRAGLEALTREITLTEDVPDLEVRVFVSGDTWTCSLPQCFAV